MSKENLDNAKLEIARDLRRQGFKTYVHASVWKKDIDNMLAKGWSSRAVQTELTRLAQSGKNQDEKVPNHQAITTYRKYWQEEQPLAAVQGGMPTVTISQIKPLQEVYEKHGIDAYEDMLWAVMELKRRYLELDKAKEANGQLSEKRQRVLVEYHNALKGLIELEIKLGLRRVMPVQIEGSFSHTVDDGLYDDFDENPERAVARLVEGTAQLLRVIKKGSPRDLVKNGDLIG